MESRSKGEPSLRSRPAGGQASCFLHTGCDNPAPRVACSREDPCTSTSHVQQLRETLPAGTFRALRIESKDDQKADVWAVKEIPFGMVKVVHADGEMVLVGHGQDAKSSIRETPIAIPGFGG